jgi:hypothetical protein
MHFLKCNEEKSEVYKFRRERSSDKNERDAVSRFPGNLLTLRLLEFLETEMGFSLPLSDKL